MLSKINEKLEEASMVQFMGKFDKNPFLLRFKGREYPIGAGVPWSRARTSSANPQGREVTS